MTTPLPSSLAPIPGVSFGRTVAITPRQIVYQATYDRRPVVVKQFIGPDAQQRMGVVAKGLELANLILGPGVNRAVQPLRVATDQGAIVMSHAQGQGMRQAFLAADPAARQELIRRAAEWLAALTVDRSEIPFKAWGRTQRLAGWVAESDFGSWGDRQLATRATARMGALARILHGRPVLAAFSHGDFHSENLFVHRADGQIVMTGIDFELRNPIPIVRDLSKMLTWLEVDDDHGTSALAGLTPQNLEPIYPVWRDLPKTDRQALHFHVGGWLLQLYLTRGERNAKIRLNVERSLRLWCGTEDLAAVL